MINRTSNPIIGCSDDDISGIIQKIRSKSLPNIITIAAYNFPLRQDRDDAIQDFYTNKFCAKSIEEIRFIESKGVGYIIRMFRNYCRDIQRKRKRDIANYQTDHIDTIEEQKIPFEAEESIDERLESIITRYKGVVAGQFNNTYAEVFVLMSRSYSTKEIAVRLNMEENNVNVAKHRIRKSLRCLAASILL